MIKKVIILVYFLVVGIGCNVNNPNIFISKYLESSWSEQIKLEAELKTSAAKVIPILLARLKEEEFARVKINMTNHSPDRTSADMLTSLAWISEFQGQIIDGVKPMLESKNRNERGWSNYILNENVFFPGDIDSWPNLLMSESDIDVLWSILYRLDNNLSHHPNAPSKTKNESVWLGKMAKALERCFGFENDMVLQLTGQCLREIHSVESTNVAVTAILEKNAGRWYLINLLRDRIGFGHPAALTQKQQENIVDVLIEMAMEKPDMSTDTLTDVIRDIPDKRVLPSFFQSLEKYKDNYNVQRHASYCIWVLFIKDMREETPKEIYDMDNLNKDPMKAGELWRQWYLQNKQRLVWDEKNRRYYVK